MDEIEWINVTKVGSVYEEEMSPDGELIRHRRIVPESDGQLPWTPGPAPDMEVRHG